MQRQPGPGLPAYQFDSLVALGLTHAVFTRLGGVSQGPFATLNVGNSVGDDPAAVAENHARIYAHMGLTADSVAMAWQVHGNRVAVVNAGHGGHVFHATDGLVTAAKGIALMLRFADCQSILLYDTRTSAIGLVHAGWRGVALGIAYRAVTRMQEAFGTNPEDLVAGLGPAIGPCCYVVGDSVASAMGYALPNWRLAMERDKDGWRLDLAAANAQQLAAAGVQRIERANLCTSCHVAEFFSHRADHGRTGRFGVVACIRPEQQGPAGGPADQPAEGHDRAPTPGVLASLQPPGLPPLQESFEGGTDSDAPSDDSSPAGRAPGQSRV